MANLSRMKKNEDLRNKIDEESTTTQTTQMNQMPVSSRSRRESTHEIKSIHPYKYTEPTPTRQTMTSSPVIEDLLDEVRQYNLAKGDSVSDDTQLNILRQINQTEESGLRKQHFLPMEEDDESIGTTMKLPRTSLESISNTSALKGLKSSFRKDRMSPLAEEQSRKTQIEEPLLQTHSPLETLNSIKNEMSEEEYEMAEKNFHKNVLDTDRLDVLEFAQSEEEARVLEDKVEEKSESKPEQKKPTKQKKKKKKVVIKEDPEKAPKERMTQGDVENERGYKAAKNGSNVLNIILIILLVLLMASIIFVVLVILKMGK